MATYGRIRSARLLVIGLLLASLVTITVDARGGGEGPLAAVGRVGVTIITPLQKAVTAIVQPIGSFFANMFRAGSLAEENEALEAQIAQLGHLLQDVPVLQAEVERFERLLGLVDELDLAEYVGAHIIAFSTSNVEWSVTVSEGSGGDVVDDMPVIANTGIPGLVGRVVQVAPDSSVVQLLIDSDFGASARLVNSRESGILYGRGEDALVLEMFHPLRQAVRIGEPVETAGYETSSGDVGVFPSGIPIGRVSGVETDPATGRTVVYVRPYVDFSRLEDVLLIRPVQRAPTESAPIRTP